MNSCFGKIHRRRGATPSRADISDDSHLPDIHLSATALLSFFQNLDFLKEQRLTIPPRGTRADGDQQKIFLSS
ncbi:MAG: hypothetical protein PHV70_13370, partial [Desulfobacteraceae bacterium]|nr:hypothetical protein [Desulfobacteraceae bacterium]